MKRLSSKKIMLIGFLIIFGLFLMRGPIENLLMKMEYAESSKAVIDFVDDAGKRIRMEKPAERIISLYSAHTENLFSLGAGHQIIGIGTADAYPMEVFDITRYDYRSDPEKVLSANPDLVIIRPFVERNNPDFVSMLRRAGITVVSLYPESYQAFGEYYRKLGMLVGREAKASLLMDEFDAYLSDVEEITSTLTSHPGVYFESSDRGYLTVTQASIPAKLINVAGGNQLAKDAKAVEKGSSIAAYGLENILTIGEDIDVYLTQRGVMGAGGNTHSISIRPGFEAVKAVREGKIVEISQKIISSPTLRLEKGINELLRFFYPDKYDNYTLLASNDQVTRSQLATMVMNYKHKGIFVPTSSYFTTDRKGHTYGNFYDVPLVHENFDFIESCVAYGYMKGNLDEEGEYFGPDEAISKAELMEVLFRLEDVRQGQKNFEALDIEDASLRKKYEKLASQGIISVDSLDDLNTSVTCKEVIESLEKLEAIYD